MKLNKFYKSKINSDYLDEIDKIYKLNFKTMINQIQRKQWTSKQQKRQKNRIIPIIALYKTFLQLGFSNTDAKELTRELAKKNALKANKILKIFSLIPQFSKIFRVLFKKGMEGNEIWTSEVLVDKDKELKVDITKCLWKDTCDFFEYPEICEIFCSLDWVVFGKQKKLELYRTQTLGMGGEKCNFTFKLK
ncbi:L-2-amino-thiazoline-4-carboxylic acid hydrolase [Clostridioides difficile]|nr:L-2-amino-thiazoline-4-carboxylic acid hydrolase [Clostridioides difficile]MDK3169756.1 L-2-amino-thiazoline-4-carboxylic acid hydrolase [Clostridioides difficile]MDN9333073.1 L-2-amino-thiazoline-4-carboxylic acid hydrolase [Clostridioides difficile]